MALDFSLATPATSANPLAAYSQGQEMQQRSFDMATRRQQAIDTQKIMQDYASEQRTTTSSVIDPLQASERDTKTAQRLFAVGNFKEGTALLNVAKENRALSKENLAEGQKTQKNLLETSSKAALVSLSDPENPVAFLEAGNRYLAAGGDPQRLAQIKTPEDQKRFLTESSKASMSAADQLKWEQNEADKKRTAEETSKRNQESHEDRQARLQATAAAKEANKILKDQLTLNQQNVHSERLNSDLARTAKPYMEDLHHIQLFKQLLKEGTPVAMQQLRQDLPAALGKFSARATNLYYKDNKNFGDIVTRLSDATYHMVAGQFSEET